MRADGQPVLNQDLWDQLDQIARSMPSSGSGWPDMATTQTRTALTNLPFRLPANRWRREHIIRDASVCRSRRVARRSAVDAPPFREFEIKCLESGHSYLKATMGSTMVARRAGR